ncbi:dioxygenase family protein [Tenuibacillus multivorans]|uniref:Catechol 1,2-dioxygenase n=1 Tax=Tenuibacillus multivorans TaxID=237069 RepID=A0A1G9ZXI6_9BACI|nr:dioxygenase [Tenuibacillus multivorans]GEL76898.1 catechol 1,2-dioxygenase [Tenuibacillus multivorans]SDN26292.1 catechol 1,2-dioxygenase [Tenuibacillus multivorans]
MSRRMRENINLFYKHLNNFLQEANLNQNEYTSFLKWADRLGRNGEWPLFAEVFIESSVLKNMYLANKEMTPSFLGPYYVEGAPILDKPYQLPMRPNEKGEKLMFSGTVKDADGTPLNNTLVDMWQVDADGHYSSFDADAPPYNLRGRFYTDENGSFEVESIVPNQRHIPKDGPTSECLNMIDQHPYRPTYLHFMFKRKDYETLITKVYFQKDESLDVTDDVRSSLMTKLYEKDDHKVASFDFVMLNAE